MYEIDIEYFEIFEKSTNGEYMKDLIGIIFTSLFVFSVVIVIVFYNTIMNMLQKIQSSLLDYPYINYMDHYPKNGKHFELFTNLPCYITQGNDEFYYRDKKGLDKQSKPHLWYVYFDTELGYIECKGFRTPENAYKYAIKSYSKLLKKELNKINCIKEIIS